MPASIDWSDWNPQQGDWPAIGVTSVVSYGNGATILMTLINGQSSTRQIGTADS